jgi:hypothetical protein
MPNDDTTLPLDGRTPEQQWAAGYLKERAIPRKFAIECGICVQRPNRRKGFNGASRGGAASKDKERAGAIVIPYFNHEGTQRDFLRYRFAEQVRNRLGLGERKFDQDPGTGAHLYMPPLRHPKGLTMKQVFADPSMPLNIAEGETRALAANYLGEPTVAIGGIDMGVVGGELCKDLRQIPMKDRKVRLLIDADVPRKESKQNSIIKLTRKLEEHGADVYLMPAPGEDNEGWDDFIATNGAKAFRKQLAEAKSCNDQAFASWGFDGIDLSLNFRPVPIEWLIKAPPPLEWTWEGYLPRGAVGLLIAQGGAGKTFFAQRLAQSVAGGLPFLGGDVRRGRAVHVVCEEGNEELRRRTRRTYWHEIESMKQVGMGASEGSIKRFTKALTENLIMHSVIGQQTHLVTTDGNNVIQGRALDVLIHQLKALGPIELLVLDPLSRLHNVPEESQTWGTAIINASERIAQEVGCSVIVVHHTGKASEREDLYAARGASALADAARVVLLLKHADAAECRSISNISDEQVSANQILRLINPKLSYGPRQRDVWLYRAQGAQGGVLDHFEPERRASVSDDNNIKMLRKWWQSHDRRPLFRETIRKQFKDIFGDTLSRRHAMNVFESAVLDGLLIPIADAKNTRSQGYVFRDGSAR